MSESDYFDDVPENVRKRLDREQSISTKTSHPFNQHAKTLNAALRSGADRIMIDGTRYIVHYRTDPPKNEPRRRAAFLRPADPNQPTPCGEVRF